MKRTVYSASLWENNSYFTQEMLRTTGDGMLPGIIYMCASRRETTAERNDPTVTKVTHHGSRVLSDMHTCARTHTHTQLTRTAVSLRDAAETEGPLYSDVKGLITVSVVSVRVGPRLKVSGARPKRSTKTSGGCWNCKKDALFIRRGSS